MRKAILAIAALIMCAQAARGQQCTGQYANDPTYAMLIPKDYAAQGGMTGTLTVQAEGSDGVPSHNLTVTFDASHNAYTPFDLHWTSNNGGSARITYTTTTHPTPTDLGPIDLNGSSNTWTSSSVGNTYFFTLTITGSGGSITLDHAQVTIIAGAAPHITWQDGLDTNFYLQATTTGGGSSMLSSCTECAGTGGGLPHCINATHTPYSTISLTNSTSGESQSLPWQQSGNIARSNESVSFNASLAISVLPGDSGTISIENKITCIMDGIIFDQQLPKPKTSPTGGSWFPRVTGELAFTKVALTVPTNCTPLLDPKGNVIGLHCAVAYYCSARSSKPDYQPTGLKTYHYTNPALVPQFWMSMSPGTALVFGDGPGQIVVWYFPFPELDGVLTDVGGMDPLLLDIISPAWVSDSSSQDCTNYAKGISPWYMPRW